MQTAFSLLRSLPWALGAGRGSQGEAVAGRVMASDRQVDDCLRRLLEDTEAEAAAPGEPVASISAQGPALPSPSH